MSRFRKLVEDIINRELLNADDAIKANKFATPIITDFFRQLEKLLRNHGISHNSQFTLDVKGIIITFIIGTVRGNAGAFNPVSKQIRIILHEFSQLANFKEIDERLRHELGHYYDNVIANKGLKKTYGDVKAVQADMKNYVKSDVETSTFYTGICNFAYMKILETLQNGGSQDIYTLFDKVFYDLWNTNDYSLRSIINFYEDEDKAILYDKAKEYIIKVFGGSDV